MEENITFSLDDVYDSHEFSQILEQIIPSYPYAKVLKFTQMIEYAIQGYKKLKIPDVVIKSAILTILKKLNV